MLIFQIITGLFVLVMLSLFVLIT